VFFENAGGSQVAQPVIDAVSESLRFRHRTKVGAKSKRLARQCIRRLLGAKDDEVIILGPNATTIIASLADQYVHVGLLRDGDEVILSTENHCANFDPWVRAAKASGATLKLWSPFSRRDPDSSARSKNLTDLLTTRTRIVAIPHASNVLGQVRDLKSLTTLVKQMTNNYCHVVVDGVAAAPHYYADLEHHTSVDWYVISCHKLFGPHLGAMFGRRSTAQHFVAESSAGMDDDTSLYKSLEMGTINYEGCAGVIGLGRYFSSLSYFSAEDAADANGVRPTTDSSPAKIQSSQSHCENPTAIRLPGEEHSLTVDEVTEAYRRIRSYEAPLADALLDKLKKSSRQVRILEGDTSMSTISTLARLPTVSFVHSRISPRAIVSECEAQGISCRCSSFLCTSYLADDFGFDHGEGVVRVSLAHYNTLSEVDTLLQVLERLPNWF
jgi:selenocysteine lyase/cysteine desulfurase